MYVLVPTAFTRLEASRPICHYLPMVVKVTLEAFKEGVGEPAITSVPKVRCRSSGQPLRGRCEHAGGGQGHCVHERRQ